MLAFPILYQRHRRKLAHATPLAVVLAVTVLVLMPAPPLVGPEVTVRIAFALVPEPLAEADIELVSRPLSRPI